MNRVSWYAITSIIFILLLLQAVVLYAFGQPAICECGYVKVWEGVVKSIGNSQHLTDWYTFSHIIHGFAFYLLLWLLFPRLHWGWRLVLALAVEVGWEILENTPMVIEHYRKQALAQGYVGDSILNSVSDSVAAIAGYLLARVSPFWLVVVLVFAMELYVGYMIRDGLALNIINLLYPSEAIAAWQSGT